MQIVKPPGHSSVEPTVGFRWFQRRDGKAPVLQQAFSIVDYDGDRKAVNARVEWRDVPTVEL